MITRGILLNSITQLRLVNERQIHFIYHRLFEHLFYLLYALKNTARTGRRLNPFSCSPNHIMSDQVSDSRAVVFFDYTILEEMLCFLVFSPLRLLHKVFHSQDSRYCHIVSRSHGYPHMRKSTAHIVDPKNGRMLSGKACIKTTHPHS